MALNALTRNRKAMFFTLIAIMMVSMFVLYFRMQTEIPMKAKTTVMESRITSMNDFVVSFEEVYAPRALYAISHRSLGAITRYTTWKNSNKAEGDETKFFVSDINWTFREVANESILYDPENPESDASGYVVLSEMTEKDEGGEYRRVNLNSTFHKLAEVAKKEMNMDLDVNVTNLCIEQDYETGPWKARVVMEIEYVVNTTGIASWRRARDSRNPIIVEFDIEEFIDPYIAGMTNGALNRSIRANKLTARQINSMDDFKELVRDGNYTFENYSAPSFLFRFEGNTSPSYCCGIESFVYPSIIYPQDDGINPQCNDRLDNDGDGQIDLPDPDCENIFDDDEFSIDRDIYRNSYLDFQYWSGRCYNEDSREDEEEEKIYYDEYDDTLWLSGGLYPLYDYLKLDSYHRFRVYPNLGSRYLTTVEYVAENPVNEGGISMDIIPKCRSTYASCEGCPPYYES